ncbi:hypothetical protein [Streptomyces sp. CC224B]|uniref:hypothetical protein n=1 Tax=Streptomyces sp. CC224B TaxID=3044571 RepID=UPI0024A973D7|nr:hypothetical protein [Streptomyces sp. CC224B]
MKMKRLLDAARGALAQTEPPHVPQIELTPDTRYRINRIRDFDGSYAATVSTGSLVVRGDATQLRRAATVLANAALCIDWATYLDADGLSPLDVTGGEPA